MSDFSYQADAQGFMIFYKSNPLGGAGIIGKYKGRRRRAQIESYREQALACIRELESGRGSGHLLEALDEIKAEEVICED